MLRVDGAYLYEFGALMRPVLQLPEQDTPLINLFFALNPLRDAIDAFLYSSVFSGSVRAVIVPAQKLKESIDQLIPVVPISEQINWERIVAGYQIIGLKVVFRTFEAVLLAELQTSALYVVPGKGGFDTSCLTDQGSSLFPADLASKVPGAIPDVEAGARCLAFDLHTAAGLHFHRANEAVLRAYFDVVAGSAERPKTRNMGNFSQKNGGARSRRSEGHRRPKEP